MSKRLTTLLLFAALVVVLGAGTMGSQIAAVCALAGYGTSLVDISKDALQGATTFSWPPVTDLPGYRVYEHGELVDEVTDVRDLWRPDLVAFLIGCSFSFEAALLANGVRVLTIVQPHLESACVSVYVRTGSRHESARLNGISHVVEHMAFKGMCASEWH